MSERETGAALWNCRGAGGTQGCRGAEKAGAMAGDGPLISVIIPVYRVEAYLEDCVRSVQRQTWQKLQIILVDDGSPDGCGALCDRLAGEDPRIEVIHKENAGLSFARNSGLDAARGSFVAFVDSDDLAEETLIGTMAEALMQNGADTVICGASSLRGGRTAPLPHPVTRTAVCEGQEICSRILLPMIGGLPEEAEDTPLMLSVWHGLYSMEIIRRWNIRFDSERELIAEDAGFQIAYLRRAGKAVLLADRLYLYRIRSDSLAYGYRPDRFEREKELFAELDRRLGAFLTRGEYRLRLERMFLGRVRVCLEAEQLRGNAARFRQIALDPLVQEVAAGYPGGKNPLRLRIFHFFLRRRAVWALRALIRLREAARKGG